MLHIIKVKVRYVGDTQQWEDKTALTLSPKSMHPADIYTLLELTIDIHEQWSQMEVYEVRWSIPPSDQGHYYYPGKVLELINIQQVE